MKDREVSLYKHKKPDCIFEKKSYNENLMRDQKDDIFTVIQTSKIKHPQFCSQIFSCFKSLSFCNWMCLSVNMNKEANLLDSNISSLNILQIFWIANFLLFLWAKMVDIVENGRK